MAYWACTYPSNANSASGHKGRASGARRGATEGGFGFGSAGRAAGSCCGGDGSDRAPADANAAKSSL
eukprot:294503-Prymnesium_polylepis.1